MKKYLQFSMQSALLYWMSAKAPLLSDYFSYQKTKPDPAVSLFILKNITIFLPLGEIY